jgi:hypothetical protein
MSERRVEMTSGANLFNPEAAFSVVGRINRERPEDAQIGLELYPVHYFNGASLGPGRISIDRIRSWERAYGPVPVERIHMPFHYNYRTAIKNYFRSFVKERGTFRDRIVASGVAWMTTVSTNNFARELAEEFDAGLNAHANIVEEAAKRGKIAEMRGDSRYVWVENDLDYPRKREDQARAARDPQRAIDAVENNGLEGVILGVDHYLSYGGDPVGDISEHEEGLKKYLKAIHLSGSGGEHSLIDPRDDNFWELVRFMKEKFDDAILCLDMNPIEMQRVFPTVDQQTEYIKGLVERLEK